MSRERGGAGVSRSVPRMVHAWIKILRVGRRGLSEELGPEITATNDDSKYWNYVIERDSRGGHGVTGLAAWQIMASHPLCIAGCRRCS